MDVYLITDDGVRECAVDELPALLAGRHGIVWVDIPSGTPRPPRCSSTCSGCTRWRCTTARSATGCPSCTRTRASLFLVLHAPERGAGGHVHHVELDRLIGPATSSPCTVRSTRRSREVALRDTREVLERIRAGRLRPRTSVRHLPRDRLDADAAHGEVRRGR